MIDNSRVVYIWVCGVDKQHAIQSSMIHRSLTHAREDKAEQRKIFNRNVNIYQVQLEFNWENLYEDF